MSVLRDLQTRAAARPAHIVLSEGHDPRVVAGALAALEAGSASKVTLVGPASEITDLLAQNGVPAGTDRISIATPETSENINEFAAEYFALRKHKGVSEDVAAQQVRDPLIFAAMMVRLGYADGTVGGAVATTSDTVRAALQIIGKDKGAALVSSFFLMALPENHPSGRSAMVFGDCGLVIDPDAAELAAIAAQSAASCQQLLGDAPNVLIFPNLDAGNIGYKIAQRIGGCDAIGPVLQGLSKPANDLSRGCTAQDVSNMIAVTALQAAGDD